MSDGLTEDEAALAVEWLQRIVDPATLEKAIKDFASVAKLQQEGVIPKSGLSPKGKSVIERAATQSASAKILAKLGATTGNRPMTDAASFVDFWGSSLVEHNRELLLTAWRAHLDPGEEDPTAGISIQKWHAGKGATLELVRALGLPEVFAGVPRPRTPAIEIAYPQRPFPPLHPYQESVAAILSSVIHAGPAPANRCILFMQTGTGKTRVTVEALLRDLPLEGPHRTILWIADRAELCEQAMAAFADVWAGTAHTRTTADRWPPPLRLTRCWGSASVPHRLEPGPSVVVATIQKLHNAVEGEGLAALREGTWAVVLDEAHKGITSTYNRVMKALGLGRGAGAARRDLPVIGLSATPVRGNHNDTATLRRRFGERLVEPEHAYADYRALVAKRILSDASTEVISTGYTLSPTAKDREHWRTFGHFSGDFLSKVGADAERSAAIIRDLEPRLAEHKAALVFACSVEHAHQLAKVLRRRGFAAAALDGGTHPGLRNRTVETFRAGDLQVLINCDLLTTGFDAPAVDLVAIARPVSSRVLYAQMIGRGLRGPLNGGTERCLIVDYEDSAGDFADLGQMRAEFRRPWAMATS